MNKPYNISDYKCYLSNTIGYTNYIDKKEAQKILKIIESKKIFIKSKHDDLKNPKELLMENIKKEEVINEIENFEYEKPYKYSILYKFNGNDIKIEDILIDRIEKEFIKHEEKFDYLSSILEKPTLILNNDYIKLKFSKLIKSKSDNYPTIKYPIIVVIHRNIDIVQIKFDGLSGNYKGEDFFAEINGQIKSWLRNILNLKLEELNSFKIVNNILQNKEIDAGKYDDVTEYIKGSEDRFNGKTLLRANDKDNLPIIDQLKLLVTEFNDEDDKKLITEFVKNLEKGVIYYIRGLKWSRKIENNKVINQIVTFRKINSKFILVHFHEGNQTREKMNYVIEYLAKHQ